MESSQSFAGGLRAARAHIGVITRDVWPPRVALSNMRRAMWPPSAAVSTFRRARDVWPPLLAILKMAKVTFWFIWVTPLVFGYIASADSSGSTNDLLMFVLVVLGVCWVESINCIHNELMDQEEDAANQPRRTTLLRSVGEGPLWLLVFAGYGVVVLGIVPVVVFVGWEQAALITAASIAPILYNAGPRLKRRAVLAEVAIAWAVFFTYLTGWSLNEPVGDVPAIIWLVTFFFGITSFLKDIPDIRGDQLVGAGGLFSIKRDNLRKVATALVYVSPFALLGVLVGIGELPDRMLWLLALLPLAVWLLVLGERVQSLGTLIVAYESSFLYVHIFFLAMFLLYTPTMAAAIAAAVLFAIRILVLYLGLAPRFVEPDFDWRASFVALMRGA